MRTIKIKTLSLCNFKGVRSLELNFTDNTVIAGDNGTGKTTIFDAFTWLLFGKDSTDRSDSNFNIKTLDAAGKPILHLEHSVTAVLSVDGSDIKLQRKYVENWVKPRGTTEETLQNHKTEYLVNDVKLGTKREYDGRISEIVNEDVFKMITNPFCFTSLPAARQKDMLLDMAGGSVTDEEVAQIKPEYVELLAQLNGRPLEEFKKEVAARKKACNDVLRVIPSQIDTANRLKPDPEDWDKLEKEISEKKNDISEIDAQMADISESARAENARKLEIHRKIGEKEIALAERLNEIERQASSGRNEALAKINDYKYSIQESERHKEGMVDQRKAIVKDIEIIEEKMSALRSEYKKISAEQLVYPDGAFICPTCKRPLEVEDIQAKQQELQESFNKDRSSRLAANKERGLTQKGILEARQKEVEIIDGKIAELTASIENRNIELEQMKGQVPELGNLDEKIAADQKVRALRNEITELKNQLGMESKPVDVSDLKARKDKLSADLYGLQGRLAVRSQIERADNEIKNLEEKRLANTQALADVEKLEFVALGFQKDKDAELSRRINGMFQLVQFSFVDEQLNGGEKLTCVCTVNGTPYPDVNNAGKINAGLDIINAICRAKGITAPIFVDNAESVNEILPTESQKVLLYVSSDKELTIK